MKTIYKVKTGLVIGIFLAGIFSCTDLEEEVLDEATGQNLLTIENLDNIVAPSYGSLRNLFTRDYVWGLQTTSSDECMFPTRGSDWEDGGLWREMQYHSWTPFHGRIRSAWDQLMQGISRANSSMAVISDFPMEGDVKTYFAELRLLRAIYSYYLLDLFGQVPFRQYDELDYSVNPSVYSGADAFNLIVSEAEAAMPDLGSKYGVPYGRMNKDIATMLLAKMYLNREVYTGEAGWTEALGYCTDLIESGRYALMSNYWNIFDWDNYLYYDDASEAIWAVVYDETVNVSLQDNTQFLRNFLHYSQTFGGNYGPWNGGVMQTDFLLRFDTINDLRYQSEIVPELGTNRGILTGLQLGPAPDYDTLKDGQIPLAYNIECDFLAGRLDGARVLKYEPKIPTINQRVDYDYIVWRIADVYLMRAEAKVRLGQNGDSDINAVRSIRGLGTLNSASLNDIIDERGFELYFEGHRRQDLIRFGKFTEAWREKPVTDVTKQLFCIPQTAIDAIGDETVLPQNPGY